MKKIITLVGAAALTLLTTSCLQQHTTLSLNKDGSGTITETTTIGAQALAMMNMNPEGPDPLEGMIEEAKAKSAESAKKMGEGVTVKEVKALDEGGKKGMVVVYEFEDINKLEYSFGQGMSSVGPGGEEQASEPLDISYKDGVFTLRNNHEKPEKDPNIPEQEIAEQQLAMAQQMMGDMRMSLSFEFPGGIAETNAEHVDGNKLTLIDIDFGKLIAQQDKFKEFMKAEPETPAEIKEMLKGVDGVKVEAAEEVTVTLK